MSEYNIHICLKSELLELQHFINEHWKKDHILAVNKQMMDWQYYNQEYGTYNFVIARHHADDKIHGILGFIPVRHFDKLSSDTGLFLAMWKIREDIGSGGLGLSLLRYLNNLMDPLYISTVGINEKTFSLYKYMGYKIGYLNHYYIVNTHKKDFRIIGNFDGHFHNETLRDKSKRLIRYDKAELLSLCNDNGHSIRASNVVPKKSFYFFYQRFFCHPIYTYSIYGLFQYDLLLGLIALRVIAHNTSRVLQIVDYFGNAAGLDGLIDGFQDLLQEYNAEYIDFYNIGLPSDMLAKSGFIMREHSRSVIIPNYFEPFENNNVEIAYAIKCGVAYDYSICKGDGDQDRPSQIRSCEMTEEND